MTEGISISSTCKNPELAVAWCDYWYTEEGQLMASWGQEGISYEFDENGEPQWTEFITNNPDGITKMNMTSMYVLNVGTINYIPTDTTGMSQYAIESLDVFMENKDDAYDIPATATFTSAESEEYNSIMGEISTYYNEVVLQGNYGCSQ